jgi:hypothetical protein
VRSSGGGAVTGAGRVASGGGGAFSWTRPLYTSAGAAPRRRLSRLECKGMASESLDAGGRPSPWSPPRRRPRRRRPRPRGRSRRWCRRSRSAGWTCSRRRRAAPTCPPTCGAGRRPSWPATCSPGLGRRPLSPAARDLALRLLATGAAAPAGGAADPALAARRTGALLALGDAAERGRDPQPNGGRRGQRRPVGGGCGGRPVLGRGRTRPAGSDRRCGRGGTRPTGCGYGRFATRSAGARPRRS